MHKQVQFKTIGMNRDLSESAFNPKFSYENKNIRIIPTDDNTFFSIVNEKGNKHMSIKGLGDNIQGTPIGQAIIDNEWVIFSTIENPKENIKPDHIYKIWFEDDILVGKLLYSGFLNFSINNPIETLVLYENEDIKKVYWVDGRNQPRFINIAVDDNTIVKWRDNSNAFDFIPKLRLREEINISRNTLSSGIFAPGVIQYAFTYYNKYGQESNIIYQSPLYYTSYNDRGASPEDSVNNSFNITINNLDTSFDYIRVYSIHRSSINGTPEVKRVVDLPIDENTLELKYTDTGTSGDFIDPTILLYVGGEEVVFDTITQKDNTLFLGNYTLKRKLLDQDIREFFKNNLVNFKLYNEQGKPYKEIIPPNPSGYYPFDNQLKLSSSNIKTFKYLEWYRFGIQAQHYTGKWSEPIWLSDSKNEVPIETTFYNNSSIILPVAEYTLNNSSILEKLKNNGYVKVRPVIVYPSLRDRESICQGVLCPTVYNVGDRNSKAPFAQASWFTRPNIPYDVNKSLGKLGDSVYELTVDIPESEEINIIPPAGETYDYIINGVTFEYVGYSKVFTEDNHRISKIRIKNKNNDNTKPPSSGTFTTQSKSFTYSSVYEIPAPGNMDNKYFYDLSGETISEKYSRYGVIKNDVDAGSYEYGIIPEIGSWVEFRHNYPIPGNNHRNAEIQAIYDPPQNPTVSDISNSLEDWLSYNNECYYIDQSILTLHSPDIEFDTEIRNLDTSNLKLRIVGMVPLTSFISDIDIQTSTPHINIGENPSQYLGFYKSNIGVENNFSNPNSHTSSSITNSFFGYRGLVSGAFWFDYINSKKSDNDIIASFAVYPWHRNGSLNNTAYPDDNGYKSAMLDKKKMSNLRFSYKTAYLHNNYIWKAEDTKTPNTSTGISGISIFDSNEMSLIKIPAPKNSDIGDITYYGNVDKVITWSKKHKDDISKGYPIVIAGKSTDVFNVNNYMFKANYNVLDSSLSDDYYSTDPVRIKYKTTSHAVLALNYTEDNYQKVLPTIQDFNNVPEYWSINGVQTTLNANDNYFWDKTKKVKGVVQDTITTGILGNLTNIDSLQYGWLWLGELYNDNVVNRFGGTTDDAFENNLWIPCGDSVPIVDNSGNALSNVTIIWNEGDTYYQRYDHIKTYPYTLEDQNSVVDIVSFMCETRVNIDGRYDRNRGLTSNLTITPDKFNKINNVYSQNNNFFNYRVLNIDKLNLNNFNNSLTWTNTKTAGELIDTWTNITLASTLDLDGDKGPLRALKRFNNNIVAFQDKGISNILYNENVQIASTEGVPIEIANSGKVSGKKYITNQVGCRNKWSICESPYGIYFVDDISKGIYTYDGNINNITTKLGFDSWIKKSSKLNIWNPSAFNSFVTYYDNTNKEILFINKEECLAYSENIGQFTSFYSYENTPYLANINDKTLTINKDSRGYYKIWLHNGGDYNMYYGKYRPFYTTVIVNPDITKDKTFNTLEFRSDSWNYNNELLDTTFDTLKVWNEYQSGSVGLLGEPGKPSPIKRKFRMWRVNIPRDECNNRDRMRNPWLYVKLSREDENIDKTILHDMVVSYFE